MKWISQLRCYCGKKDGYDRAIPEPRLLHTERDTRFCFYRETNCSYIIVYESSPIRIYIYFLEPFQNRDRACQYFRIEIIEFNLISCYYLISCNPPIVPFERKFFRIILNLTRSIFRRCKSDLMNCIFLVNLTRLV